MKSFPSVAGLIAVVCAAPGEVHAELTERVLILDGSMVPSGATIYTAGVRNTLEGDSFCGGAPVTPISQTTPSEDAVVTHAQSMTEKKEVVQLIEKNGGVPTPAAAYFKNEGGWKVSEAQVRYWWTTEVPSVRTVSMSLRFGTAKKIVYRIQIGIIVTTTVLQNANERC
ncbi:hypothetical protein ON010_g11859 [Phytophthora cinnamomi]|nr:hypothetical protein ON010_g11859 [Phytophthora cinnamomi]